MDIKTANLNLLPTLAALLAEESISGASRRLGRSQPAVSMALGQLRELLGDPLLVRSGRRMVLTRKGHSLRGGVERAVRELEELLGGTTLAQQVRVTVAMNDYVEQLFVPALASELARSHRHVDLQTSRLPRLFEPPVPQLETGVCDIAVGFFQTPESSAPGPLRYEPLLDEPRTCISSVNNEVTRKAVSLKTYCRLPHVAVASGDSTGAVDRLLATRGLRRHVAVSVQSILVVPSVVARSPEAVAIVPKRLVEHSADRRRLRLFRPPLPIPAVPIGMIWHERSTSDPSTALILRLLRSGAAEHARPAPLDRRLSRP